MNFSGISERLAHNISAELNYSEDKKEIVAYGIESTILTVIGFIAVLLVAYPLNALLPAATAAIFGGSLRKLSGGAHFNTPLKCLVFGTLVYSFIGVISKGIIKANLYSTGTLFLVLIISLVIIVRLAPVDCEAKPINSLSFRKNLKIASSVFIVFVCVVVLLSNNSLLNTGAVLGIVYQTITLLPVFNKKKKEVTS